MDGRHLHLVINRDDREPSTQCPFVTLLSGSAEDGPAEAELGLDGSRGGQCACCVLPDEAGEASGNLRSIRRSVPLAWSSSGQLQGSSAVPFQGVRVVLQLSLHSG